MRKTIEELKAADKTEIDKSSVKGGFDNPVYTEYLWTVIFKPKYSDQNVQTGGMCSPNDAPKYYWRAGN